MTIAERSTKLAEIAALSTDGERLAAYQALHALEVAELRRFVLMCTCADWLRCSHPWPQRMP